MSYTQINRKVFKITEWLRQLSVVIIVDADVLALLGARTTAGTVMTRISNEPNDQEWN